MVAHGLRISNYCLPDGREEGKREGGIEGGGGGGASEPHIYICISTLHLVIRGKNQLPPKILWRRRVHCLFSSKHKHQKTEANPSFVCPDARLNLPGQLGFGLLGSESESGHNHGYGSGLIRHETS